MIITAERRYRVRVAESESDLNSPSCIMNAYNTGNYNIASYTAMEDVQEYDSGVCTVDEWDFNSDCYKVILKYTYSKNKGYRRIKG